QARLGGNHVTEVVGRDVRGHADGDARRSVDGQVRQASGQYGRLPVPVVVVRHEVDGVLVDIRERLGADGREAGLGVARSARGVVVDRVVDEDTGAEREVLGQVDGEVVDVGAARGLDLAHLLG